MRDEREEFIDEVDDKVRYYTQGPGGSMFLNEAGRRAVGDRYDRGEFDTHNVADFMIRTGVNLFLTAEWEDEWF